MSTEHILGLVTGIFFGILLQKARVLRFEKQVAAMQFKDMTILKFMMSAILVGMLGVTVLKGMGVITLDHKSMNVGGVLLGGALFGGGWAIAGYCPGTSIGALGEGRWGAIFAVLGMVAGAAVYAEIYPFLSNTVLAWKDYGKIGLSDAWGVSPWVLNPAFWVLFTGMFLFFENKHI